MPNIQQQPSQELVKSIQQTKRKFTFINEIKLVIIHQYTKKKNIPLL